MSDVPDGIVVSARPPRWCPSCGGMEFSGPSAMPGLGCACHPDTLAWVCTTCNALVQTPVVSPPAGQKEGT